MSKQKIGVFIVEDHAFTRDGLRVSINRSEDLQVVGEARSGEEALEKLQNVDLANSVIVMDIGLPGMDGIEATKKVKGLFPELRVVMLTAHKLEDEILASLASGADAYCLKSTDPQSLILAIRGAAIGSTYLDPQVAHVVLACIDVPNEIENPLSSRELEVLQHVAEGKSNRQIAESLSISVATVKTHVQEILIKLSATDRTQAAVKALRQGLL